MPSVVSLRQVHKNYGSHEVLKGVSFEVGPGDVVILLGPNGAGKTTTFNLMLGRQTPTSGEVRLMGQDPSRHYARKRIGVTPQESDFPKHLLVRELVGLVRSHYADPMTADTVRDDFLLQEIWSRQAGGLSGGQRRRLGLALAFCGNPDTIFLDEPTTGLDYLARKNLWSRVQSMAKSGKTFFLTTHYLEEAEALSTKVLVLRGGKLIYSGTADAFRKLAPFRRVRVWMPKPVRLEAASACEPQDDHFVFYTPNSDALVKELVRRDIEFTDLQVLPATLEDALDHVQAVQA
ncbi:MAG TPA: ABC transporter ATP-binding protein [Bdellovibrionales bacterium]|nr:ABC transporter ATP-binding protein [Bdellovibrionales bacterium]